MRANQSLKTAIESQAKNIIAGLCVTLAMSFTGWVALSIYNSYISPAQKRQNEMVERTFKVVSQKDSIKTIHDIVSDGKLNQVISSQIELKDDIKELRTLLISFSRDMRSVGLVNN